MDFINQPMVETLPVIWNKLCQFFIWLFTKDPSDKINMYKILILALIGNCLTVNPYLFLLKKDNIIIRIFGIVIGNIIFVLSMLFFINFEY